MSERQAKLKRKNSEQNKETAKKVNKAEVIMNIIVVAVIVAVLGLGTWAVVSKVQNKSGDNVVTDNIEAGEEQTQPQTTTLADYAEQMGTTAEDFIKDYGLEDTDVNPDMDIALAIEYMSLENFAKFSNTTVDEIKKNYELDDNFSSESLMSEVYAMLQERSMQEVEESEEAQEENEEENETESETESDDAE